MSAPEKLVTPFSPRDSGGPRSARLQVGSPVKDKPGRRVEPRVKGAVRSVKAVSRVVAAAGQPPPLASKETDAVARAEAAAAVMQEQEAQKQDYSLGLLERQLGQPRATFLAQPELHWSVKGLRDEHAPAVAHVLQTNKELQELGLARNQLTGQGAVTIAHALHHAASLRVLWLSGNRPVSYTHLTLPTKA